MDVGAITLDQKKTYDELVAHPLQSFAWGQFREQTGVKVIRRGFFQGAKLTSAFTLTIHKIPHSPFTIGYLPKGELPTKELVTALQKIGKEEQCLFIQLEPNVIRAVNENILPAASFDPRKFSLVKAAHPLFTKFTFVLDLTKSEDELLQAMHPKARYNIKVAKKHAVSIKEDSSEKAFEAYWRLTEETTTRQKFYAHTKKYHELQWRTFSHDNRADELTSHLFTASYAGKTLTTLLFFVFHDTLYYPYGASSNEHRNVMHSNLAMWEAIQFGKKLGLKKFDMWGALGQNPDPKDSWFGFHTFKERFGPDHIEFLGSFDLVINPGLYQTYKLADKLRWLYLKIKK